MADYKPDSGPQTLMEVNLRAERRRLMDGEDPLPSGEAIGRVVWLGGGSIPMEGVRPDSRTVMRMPSPVVNDERLAEVTVGVVVGYHAAVLISSERPVPKEVLRPLAERSARELLAAVERSDDAEGFADAIDVAGEIRYAALAVLRGRISEVEQSVRDALSDEHVTEEDYAALREYPALLAMVEEQAGAVRDTTSESLRPEPSPSVLRVPTVQAMDTFFRDADDVQREARQAVATLSGLVSSQQVVMVQRQRLEVERLQRIVTVVGAAVLVPGLVAATFGANVDVPGENTAAGFWGMLLLMGAGGLGSYWLLKSVEGGLLTRLIDRVEVAERMWLRVLAASALVLFAAGVAILVNT